MSALHVVLMGNTTLNEHKKLFINLRHNNNMRVAVAGAGAGPKKKLVFLSPKLKKLKNWNSGPAPKKNSFFVPKIK